MAAASKSRPNPAVNRPPVASRPVLPARQTAESKTQLGACISEAKYRQLKLPAVLRGVTVQTLVEQAILEFLINHPELLQSSVSEHLPNHRHESRDSQQRLIPRILSQPSVPSLPSRPLICVQQFGRDPKSVKTCSPAAGSTVSIGMVHRDNWEFSQKKRSISRLASGPRGSV